jgi:hypothetical protein
VGAGAAPVGLGHRRRQFGEVDASEADREVLVATVSAGVVEVDVRDAVAVRLEEVGLLGPVHPGAVRVAGVETHRRVRPRQKRRDVRHVDDVALKVLGAGGDSTFGGVLVEPLDGRAEGVDDQLVVPVEGPSERPRVEDGSPGPEFGCDVDARLQLTAGASPRLGMRRADIDRERQVYHDVEVVLGGRRPDGRGVDGVPGEPHPMFNSTWSKPASPTASKAGR